MRIVNATHLVVGGGLLGLATADHLLRRGAEGVVVIEAKRALGNLHPSRPGVLLSTGRLRDRPMEDRNRVLLEEWPDYLEVDPKYRRSGSFEIPALEAPPTGWENLSSAQFRRRLSGDVDGPSESTATFVPQDGGLDIALVAQALHEQIRRRGGRVITDSPVSQLSRSKEGLRFEASQRSGRCEQIYLTAGAANLRLARQLEVALPYRGEIRHQFDIAGPKTDFRIFRSRAPLAQEADPGLLESEFLDVDSLDSASDGPMAEVEPVSELWIETPEGQRSFVSWLPGRVDDSETPSVAFDEWRAFGDRWRECIPTLDQSSVRSASADPTLALGDSVEPIQCDSVHVGGAFGAHGLALAFAVGEQLAEAGLTAVE